MDEQEKQYQFFEAYERFKENRRIRGTGKSEIVEYIRLSRLWDEAGQPEDMDKFISEHADKIP